MGEVEDETRGTRGRARPAVLPSRVSGLRIDARAGGVRMGGFLPRRRGRVRCELDVDGGPARIGQPLNVQVLVSAAVSNMPEVIEAVDVRVPSDHQPVLEFDASLDPDRTRWAVLRICDPERSPDPRAEPPFDGFGAAIAYASPFFFGRDRR